MDITKLSHVLKSYEGIMEEVGDISFFDNKISITTAKGYIIFAWTHGLTILEKIKLCFKIVVSVWRSYE